MNFHKKGLCCAVLAGLLLFSGCSAPSGGTSQKQEGLLDPEKPVTITVWTYYNGQQLSSFNALVEKFNTTVGLEQGIFVESMSQGSVTDLEANVLSAAQGKAGAGEVPNIFAAYVDTAYTLDQMGLVADLTPYLTQEEQDAFVDSYIDEGRFSGDGSVKIFPVAKSVEIFMLNATDWDKFAQATGAGYEDFSTMEGLVSTAQAYYEWTDSLTPEPNDGKAFFGRDAMANYLLIGAMQLGTQLFSVQDGKMVLDFNRDTVRKLWDNYYVPYVKGYFASSGRFRSDDIKTGNIISFVGSSSGATFFPEQVIVSDTQSYPIQTLAFPCPQFEGGAPYAVQQGAGMVVTAGDEAEEYASVEFLKWFTQDERNISFSVNSGYLPVTKTANDLEAILSSQDQVTALMEKILTAAVGTVNENQLYTPKAFQNGTDARSVLEYSMSDAAAADRAVVEERLAQGQELEQAAAEFVSDEYFDAWYAATLAKLEQFAG